MADTRTLTEMRGAGMVAARALHDGLPIFDGWKHVGKAANGDPVYVRACDGCGDDFGQPEDRTDTADERALCRTCADAEGLVSAW